MKLQDSGSAPSERSPMILTSLPLASLFNIFSATARAWKAVSAEEVGKAARETAMKGRRSFFMVTRGPDAAKTGKHAPGFWVLGGTRSKDGLLSLPHTAF